MVGNFIFPKADWLRWAGQALARLHPLFNAEEIDDLGEKIFSIETETLVMLNCTKNTLKILESDYINNFVIVIVHTTGPWETNTLYWEEMSTWDPTCYNDWELLHQLTITLMIRAVSPSLHIYHCYICINTGQYNYIIEYLFVFAGLSWRSQILE